MNFGVGGYGSYQAVLRFIRHTQRGLVSPYTILVIYEENIKRVANAYRPFYVRTTGGIYGYKPFVAWENDRAIFYENPNRIPRGSLGDFVDLVQLYERTDYWSTHRNVHVWFPFSINLM